MCDNLLLTDEQRKWFLEIECTPGEEIVVTGEVTTKGFRI